jgi:hypothetical protein
MLQDRTCDSIAIAASLCLLITVQGNQPAGDMAGSASVNPARTERAALARPRAGRPVAPWRAARHAAALDRCLCKHVQPRGSKHSLWSATLQFMC